MTDSRTGLVVPRGRRPSGDPDAMLAALPPRLREAFLEGVELLDLGPRWEQAPAIASFIELASFACEVRRIREEEKISAERAQFAAAIRLGLREEAVTRRLHDQRRRSRAGSEKISEGSPVDAS